MIIDYYDKFSKVYDLFSPKQYYHKARREAVEVLELEINQTVLNVPCGTGQNFEYFQEYLKNTGLIIGIDLSTGMLGKAKNKRDKDGWTNIRLVNADVLEVDEKWVKENVAGKLPVEIDAILCDLGLSAFPEWQKAIDNLLAILKPGGKIVVMDWYMDKPSLRGEFVNWIGKGEIDRPIWQYLETKVANFRLTDTFNRGGVFVASGNNNE
jgi:ubiquinone/menaquinone biosynthesis C-methylase UbiE